jgi:hypothetical protein
MKSSTASPGRKWPTRRWRRTVTIDTTIIVFVAKDVPALGYKACKVIQAVAPPRFPASGVTLAGNVIENEFYRVEMDSATGAVSSILDKQLRRELVDRRGPDKVNQYFYHSITGGHEEIYHDKQATTHQGRVWTKDLRIATYTPLAVQIAPGQNGPAMKSLRAEIRMEQGPAPTELIQEVILYPGIRRIDFVNRLHKAATLAKEEACYAFPFDVPGFEINCELPGAVFRPGKDQLSGSFTGFGGIQHWADASNSDFGVTVATREVPAIEFGEIRTNEWSMSYVPSRSAFYFYVMNNKENANGAQWQGSESWRLRLPRAPLLRHQPRRRLAGRQCDAVWLGPQRPAGRAFRRRGAGGQAAAGQGIVLRGPPEERHPAEPEARRRRQGLRRPFLRDRRPGRRRDLVRPAHKIGAGAFEQPRRDACQSRRRREQSGPLCHRAVAVGNLASRTLICA